jgi:hypothetical protein
MKPTDKAILGMVSELSGRNVSEPRSGLVKKCFRRPSPLFRDEGCRTCRKLAEASCHLRRGGRDGTMTRACQATDETVLVPLGNQWSKVNRITGQTGQRSIKLVRGRHCGSARRIPLPSEGAACLVRGRRDFEQRRLPVNQTATQDFLPMAKWVIDRAPRGRAVNQERRRLTWRTDGRDGS